MPEEAQTSSLASREGEVPASRSQRRPSPTVSSSHTSLQARTGRDRVQIGHHVRQHLHPMSKRIFVGNLSWGTTEEDLRNAFAAQGFQIQDVHILLDRESGRSRGCLLYTSPSPRD